MNKEKAVGAVIVIAGVAGALGIAALAWKIKSTGPWEVADPSGEVLASGFSSNAAAQDWANSHLSPGSRYLTIDPLMHDSYGYGVPS